MLKEETTILYLQDRSIKNYSEFIEQEQPADNWSKVCRNKIEEVHDWLVIMRRLTLNKTEYQN